MSDNVKIIEYTIFLECPKCGFKIEETEDLAEGLITYHGELGQLEFECTNCSALLAIEEHVSRTYSTELVEKYFVLCITPKDKTLEPYIYEQNHTYTERVNCERQQQNVERFIATYKNIKKDLTGTIMDIEKFEIKEVIV